MLKNPPAFLVAGTHSGCGKTTIALALMAVLTERGLRVAPFKTGPDFIDPGFHRLICGRPSHNLDTWMMTEEAVRRIFWENISGCDVAVIEGAMGLFDGASGVSEKGSAAHVAKVLGVPVILVVDATSMGRSICALIKGFLEYDGDLKIAGVIVNKAGSSKHKRIIRQALSGLNIPFLAIVGRDKGVFIPSRHLGLVTALEGTENKEFFEGLTRLIFENDLDIDLLLGHASRLFGENCKEEDEQEIQGVFGADSAKPVKIAVAFDQAFCFYYQRNLDILKGLGARLLFFSPLSGETLPEDSCGLYLGGGYPELYKEELSENKGLIEDIRKGAEKCLPILAECGGFMFLGRGLKEEGRRFYWCGLFDSWFEMAKRFQALGYRQALIERPCILGGKGTTFKGHEFRYSFPTSPKEVSSSVIKALDASDEPVIVPSFVYKNVFASYIHIHFESNRDVAASFVETCRKYAESDFKT